MSYFRIIATMHFADLSSKAEARVERRFYQSRFGMANEVQFQLGCSIYADWHRGTNRLNAHLLNVAFEMGHAISGDFPRFGNHSTTRSTS